MLYSCRGPQPQNMFHTVFVSRGDPGRNAAKGEAHSQNSIGINPAAMIFVCEGREVARDLLRTEAWGVALLGPVTDPGNCSLS